MKGLLNYRTAGLKAKAIALVAALLALNIIV